MATKEWLPPQLVDKVIEAAANEEISPEEYVRAAVETRLSRAEWTKTLEYGERHAHARGLKPEDVEVEISAVRTERTR